MWGHKTGFSKFKKIEIISSIIADHNAMRVEIKYKKKKCKTYKHIEAKQYVTNNQWVTEEIKEE